MGAGGPGLVNRFSPLQLCVWLYGRHLTDPRTIPSRVSLGGL